MNAKRFRRTSTLAIVLLGAAGFSVGWFTARQPDIATQSAANANVATTPARAAQAAGPEARTAQRQSAAPPHSLREWIPSALSAGPHSLAAALAEPDELRRVFLLEEWAAQAPLADLPAAIERIQRHPSERLQYAAMSALFSRWASLAPEAALAAVATSGNEYSARRAAIIAWTKRDAAAAFAWLQRSPTAAGRDPFSSGYNEFVETLIELGRLAEAAAFASRMGSDVSVSFAQNRVAVQLARKDPAAALQWFDTLPPGDSRTSAFNGLIAELAKTDPDIALRTALSSPVAAERKTGVSAAAVAWAKRDFAGATDWLLARRDDPEVHSAMSGIVATQGAANPEVATRLLDSIADANLRQNAIRQLAPALVRTDPSRSLDLVLRYATPQARFDLLERTVKTWAAKDGAAARAFIASDPRLTQDDRDELTSALPPKK